ncbi:hypothetical protein ACQPZZ_16920 [Microbispora sp. CA-135349]|uniref:hypothetical protein n=1 Tax=Microbispora sp. CA-135349 TaxID=3239953 RepID=UPI003D8E00F7
MTLLTGDRVVVTGRSFRVEPGADREVHFSSGYRNGHLYVIPSDAVPLISRKVLDERLFDVTHDADTADIPLITQAPQGTTPTLKARGWAGVGHWHDRRRGQGSRRLSRRHHRHDR